MTFLSGLGKKTLPWGVSMWVAVLIALPNMLLLPLQYLESALMVLILLMGLLSLLRLISWDVSIWVVVLIVLLFTLWLPLQKLGFAQKIAAFLEQEPIQTAETVLIILTGLLSLLNPWSVIKNVLTLTTLLEKLRQHPDLLNHANTIANALTSLMPPSVSTKDREGMACVMCETCQEAFEENGIWKFRQTLAIETAGMLYLIVYYRLTTLLQKHARVPSSKSN